MCVCVFLILLVVQYVSSGEKKITTLCWILPPGKVLLIFDCYERKPHMY